MWYFPMWKIVLKIKFLDDLNEKHHGKTLCGSNRPLQEQLVNAFL